MKELRAIALIFLLLSQSVSAIEPGEKRQYDYYNEFTYTYDDNFDGSSIAPIFEDHINDSAEYMVEFQRFAYTTSFDIRPPRFYVETKPRSKVMIPGAQIFNYSGMIDRTCPAIDRGMSTLFYMGETIDIDSCLRKNMYYSALNPIFVPETFPQNSSVIGQLFTQSVPSIEVEQPLTVRYIASLLLNDLPIDEALYTYQATLRLISTDGQIGYSVSAKLRGDYAKLLQKLADYGLKVTVYGDWERTEKVLYDLRTGWILSQQSNLSFSRFSWRPEASSLEVFNSSDILLDISPPFLNGIIPDEFLIIAGVLFTLVVLYMVWKWRRRRRGSEGQKEDLYPEQ